MSRELYVGNIPFETTEQELRRLLAVAGTVSSIHLITDPVSGQFKGCCYVRMATPGEAREAINCLDGALVNNRLITVSEARPQKPKGPQPGGGGPGKRRWTTPGSRRDRKRREE